MEYCPPWLTILNDNVSINLDDILITLGGSFVSTTNPNPMEIVPRYEILWSSDETEFIMRSPAYSLSSTVNLLSLSDDNVVVTPLYPSSLWDDFFGGFPHFGVDDVSISPSGRYILLSAQASGTHVILYDRKREQSILLDGLGFAYPDSIWLDDENFLAVMASGITLYNITQYRYLPNTL